MIVDSTRLGIVLDRAISDASSVMLAAVGAARQQEADENGGQRSPRGDDGYCHWTTRCGHRNAG